jgi:hypothetical protein
MGLLSKLDGDGNLSFAADFWHGRLRYIYNIVKMVGDRYCGGNSKELGAGELTILSLAKVACSTRPEHVVLWCWGRPCADCSESCGLGLLSAVPVSASRLIN